MVLELALTVLAVAAALAVRPWRMLRGPLLSPALAALAVLPWLWLLPQNCLPAWRCSSPGPACWC